MNTAYIQPHVVGAQLCRLSSADAQAVALKQHFK